MSETYGCGLHRPGEVLELKVKRENGGMMMGTPYKHTGKMHAIFHDDGSVSICHTAPDGQWCPELFTHPAKTVLATDPLEAVYFHCPRCEIRGGTFDNTFIRRFTPPPGPDRRPIDGYPMFKRWLHYVEKVLAEQSRREKADKKHQERPSGEP